VQQNKTSGHLADDVAEYNIRWIFLAILLTSLAHYYLWYDWIRPVADSGEMRPHPLPGRVCHTSCLSMLPVHFGSLSFFNFILSSSHWCLLSADLCNVWLFSWRCKLLFQSKIDFFTFHTEHSRGWTVCWFLFFFNVWLQISRQRWHHSAWNFTWWYILVPDIVLFCYLLSSFSSMLLFLLILCMKCCISCLAEFYLFYCSCIIFYDAIADKAEFGCDFKNVCMPHHHLQNSVIKNTIFDILAWCRNIRCVVCGVNLQHTIIGSPSSPTYCCYLGENFYQQDCASAYRAHEVIELQQCETLTLISPDLWLPNGSDFDPVDCQIWGRIMRIRCQLKMWPIYGSAGLTLVTKHCRWCYWWILYETSGLCGWKEHYEHLLWYLGSSANRSCA